MKKKYIGMLLAWLCGVMTLSAQTGVSGRVINADTNEPVVGANIRVDHSLTGDVTNTRGEFTISNLPEGTHTLNVSHLNYTTEAREVRSGETDIVIRMRESMVQLGQVVVTGTGTHHLMKNSPVPVNVITSRELSNAGISTLDEALQKLTPSFSNMTNGMGTTLSLNGLPEKYFVFLENGRRMGGDNTYERIDVSRIKRIEILSGASSALYGTNAVGGVVNIITNDVKHAVNLSSDTRYTSHGRFTQSIAADVNTGRFGSYTSYRRSQAESWQLSPYERNKKDSLVETQKVASAGFHSDNVNQRFTYDATDRLSFQLRGGYFRNITRRPAAAYDYDLQHRTYSWGAGVKYLLSPDAYITADYQADFFSSRYNFLNASKTYKTQPGDELVRKRTRNQQANVKGIFNLGERNKVSVGVEYLADMLSSPTENISHKTAYTAAIFAQDEITITRQLRALAGVRYLYHEFFKSYATPNVALMYGQGGLNLRASYAAGFRAPTLSELYASETTKAVDRITIGNLNLKPEKSDYFSLNAEYAHSRFTVSTNFFYNRIRDMIDYRTIATGEEAKKKYGHEEVRQRDNVYKAEVRGINVAAQAYLGAGFRIGAGYTHLDTKDDETGRPIDKSLRNAANVNAQWTRTWGGYTMNIYLNGRINSERFSKTYGYAPAYQVWDLNTRHTFTLRSVILEPGVGIENLFNYTDDRPYNFNYATLTPGRSVYVSLSIKFRG